MNNKRNFLCVELPYDMMRELSDFCEAIGMKRSEFVRLVLRSELRRLDDWDGGVEDAKTASRDQRSAD